MEFRLNQLNKMLKDFKPVVFFLLRFLAIYLVGNLSYGLFVTYFEPGVDPITYNVTKQISWVLNVFGNETFVTTDPNKHVADLKTPVQTALSIYEGCNGVNVWIIFAAFLFAMGPVNKKIFYFLLWGTIAIHISNLLRIGLLFFVSFYLPNFWYFTHKYLFTAFIYLIVFALWIMWVRMQLRKNEKGV